MPGPSIEELAARAAESPDDADAAFDYASALDGAAREADAIPVYRTAISLGLDPELEYQASVQLGSSLRVIGEPSESVDIHRRVLARWPDRPSNRLFLALALRDAGLTDEALREAFAVALAEPVEQDISLYRRALTDYIE
jgi:cyanophycin synthetase